MRPTLQAASEDAAIPDQPTGTTLSVEGDASKAQVRTDNSQEANRASPSSRGGPTPPGLNGSSNATRPSLVKGSAWTLYRVLSISIVNLTFSTALLALWRFIEIELRRYYGCVEVCYLPFGGGEADIRKFSLWGYFGIFWVAILTTNSIDNVPLWRRLELGRFRRTDPGAGFRRCWKTVAYVASRVLWPLLSLIPVWYTPTADSTLGVMIGVNALGMLFVGSIFLWYDQPVKMRFKHAIAATIAMAASFGVLLLGYWTMINTDRLSYLATFIAGGVYPVVRVVTVSQFVEISSKAYHWSLDDPRGTSHFLAYLSAAGAGFSVPTKVRILTFERSSQFWVAVFFSICTEIGTRLWLVYVIICVRQGGEDTDAENSWSDEEMAYLRTSRINSPMASTVDKKMKSWRSSDVVTSGDPNGRRSALQSRHISDDDSASHIEKASHPTRIVGVVENTKPGTIQQALSLLPSANPQPDIGQRATSARSLEQCNPKQCKSPTNWPWLMASHRCVQHFLITKFNFGYFPDPRWHALQIAGMTIAEYLSLGMTVGLLYFHWDASGSSQSSWLANFTNSYSNKVSMFPITGLEPAAQEYAAQQLQAWWTRGLIMFFLQVVMDLLMGLVQRKQMILWERLPPFNGSAYASVLAFLGCTMCAFLTVYRGLLT